MSDVSLKLSAKDIYEKDFEKTMARGYRREEVDAFLDDIITDYQKMADMNNEVVKLSEENHKLKKELEELKFAFTCCKTSFSNSVVIAKDGGTLALGQGETKR